MFAGETYFPLEELGPGEGSMQTDKLLGGGAGGRGGRFRLWEQGARDCFLAEMTRNLSRRSGLFVSLARRLGSCRGGR